MGRMERRFEDGRRGRANEHEGRVDDMKTTALLERAGSVGRSLAEMGVGLRGTGGLLEPAPGRTHDWDAPLPGPVMYDDDDDDDELDDEDVFGDDEGLGEDEAFEEEDDEDFLEDDDAEVEEGEGTDDDDDDEDF